MAKVRSRGGAVRSARRLLEHRLKHRAYAVIETRTPLVRRADAVAAAHIGALVGDKDDLRVDDDVELFEDATDLAESVLGCVRLGFHFPDAQHPVAEAPSRVDPCACDGHVRNRAQWLGPQVRCHAKIPTRVRVALDFGLQNAPLGVRLLGQTPAQRFPIWKKISGINASR